MKSIATLGALALLAGCAGMHDGGAAKPSGSPSAEAALAAKSGSNVSGTVTFSQKGDNMVVVAAVSGLTPGSHGFHIHDKGDCSAPDAMSAGGHFNPGGKPHGNPHQGEHHAGDMPMLEADAGGNARLNTELAGVSLEGANGIVGRSVIVHANPDDFQTQPTGNSGGRVACGLIAKK